MPINIDPWASPPAWWTWCAPYIRKLIVAALKRKGVIVSWPVT